MDEPTHLIFHLRTARAKARAAAVAEAFSLLSGLGASVPAGGPLGETGGVFWIDLPAEGLEEACARFERLGYTVAVDQLGPPAVGTRARLPIRWRKRYFSLTRLYAEPADEMRAAAPDRRKFLLETRGGHVREVTGYRGEGGAMSKRALAACDARLLVNLVFNPSPRRVLLDPFAGAGNIVSAGIAAGWQVFSADCDPVLRFGLAHLATFHCVADARALPLKADSVEAIATEPPFDRQTESLLAPALTEMHRVLKASGKLAVLCATWQTEPLCVCAAKLGLQLTLECPVDRKGMGCTVMVWRKEQ